MHMYTIFFRTIHTPGLQSFSQEKLQTLKGNIPGKEPEKTGTVPENMESIEWQHVPQSSRLQPEIPNSAIQGSDSNQSSNRDTVDQSGGLKKQSLFKSKRAEMSRLKSGEGTQQTHDKPHKCLGDNPVPSPPDPHVRLRHRYDDSLESDMTRGPLRHAPTKLISIEESVDIIQKQQEHYEVGYG